jgi:hypothetical protein
MANEHKAMAEIANNRRFIFGSLGKYRRAIRIKSNDGYPKLRFNGTPDRSVAEGAVPTRWPRLLPESCDRVRLTKLLSNTA